MSSKRPKGYMTWRPSDDVAEIISQCKAVLREYSGYGPMTVRQIFYRLVGNYGYQKDERAYKRLAEYLVKARRAQMISFDRIRDDGGTTHGGAYGFETVDEFLADLASYGESYRIRPTLGQPYHVELWCEAEGMVPMLAQMVRPFGADVTGTGGFSSVTVTHSFAARVASRDKPTVLLHVGDYDPSGESIFLSMCQDIGSFVAGKAGGIYYENTGEVEDADEKPLFIPRRVALTEDQVAQYDLPTAPPKSSDSRSVNWDGETTQAEAMPPDLLASVVTAAVEEWWDASVAEELDQREERERELIGSRVSDAVNEIRDDLKDEE